MWSIWDAPSDRDYYAQLECEWEEDKARDSSEEEAATPDELSSRPEMLVAEDECPF